MIDSTSIAASTQLHHRLAAACLRILSLGWVPFALAILFIGLDYFSGPFIQFPATFVIPTALAAWFQNFRVAAVLAVGQPVCNLIVTNLTDNEIPGMPFPMTLVNTGIRVTVLLILAYFVSRTSRLNHELSKRVGLLRGEIPTCFCCGKAEDEMKNWIPLDIYVARHTGVHFTEALCPACAREKSRI